MYIPERGLAPQPGTLCCPWTLSLSSVFLSAFIKPQVILKMTYDYMFPFFKNILILSWSIFDLQWKEVGRTWKVSKPWERKTNSGEHCLMPPVILTLAISRQGSKKKSLGLSTPESYQPCGGLLVTPIMCLFLEVNSEHFVWKSTTCLHSLCVHDILE